MEQSEFARIAVKSSQRYLEYCRGNNKGSIIIKVYGVEPGKEPDRFHLRMGNLNSRTSLESCAVRLFLTPGYTLPYSYYSDMSLNILSQGLIKVKSYDREQNMLEVSVDPLLVPIFRDSLSRYPGNLQFVDDMTFLIEAVRNWYAADHNFSLTQPSPNVKIYDKTLSALSTEQRNAVKVSLTSPFSYIWGPPGTGKTWTMAHAVMQLVKSNESVLIIAPTNNAIDQSLRTVIRVFEQHGINTDRISRFGIPTAEFERDFPQVCEASHLSKLIESYQGQIKSLEQTLAEASKTAEALRLISRYHAVRGDYDSANEKLTGATDDYKTAQIDLDNATKQMAALKNHTLQQHQLIIDLKGKEDGIWFRLNRYANSKKYEEHQRQLKQAEDAFKSGNQALAQLTGKYTQFKKKRDECQSQMKASQDKVNKYMANIQALSKEILGQFVSVQISDASIIEKEALCRSCVPASEIEKQLKDFRQKLDATRKRISMVTLVYACTIDYAYCHYDDLLEIATGGFPFAHVFVDEAAYLPLIKAGIAFSFDAPVTLCGDHKQLPPVCVMDEERIHETRYASVFLWAQSALYFGDVFSNSIEEMYDTYLTSGDMLSSDIASAFLPKTYRFGNNLAKILDSFVYHNGFFGVSHDTDIIIINAMADSQSTGRKSLAEAKAIKDYLSSNPLEDYVILTPYVDQKDLMQKELRPVSDADHIKTVHAAQGREWDTVIFSVVDCRRLFFCNSQIPIGLKVMNTAISRAIRQIVIVCDQNFWLSKSDTQLIGRLTSDHVSHVYHKDP